MQFYRKRAVSASVPIVPMIDILTILLIFFIVHTQWKKPQHLLKIDVPGVEYIEGEQSAERRGVLAVSAGSVITLDGQEVPLEKLAGALKTYCEANPDKKLQMDVDKGASFGTIVRIWDTLTAVGVDAKEVPARIEIQQGN